MLNNTEHGYGWMHIALHWLVALAVFGLFGLGLYMVELSYYDSWYKGSVDLHKSIGLTLALLFVLRLVWRLTQARPQPVDSSLTWQNRVAHWVHITLYLVLIVVMVSGYLTQPPTVVVSRYFPCLASPR